ncbi:NAD-dependent glycerol-3-phosphate dehydrogenase [Basidiobolus meristosporus CBS 931.73]|uniref:Glycerol-3-phosphate dehydrogenase [NAD(+)] n=1 Tax=Basidiobolus meristosporus CBS 931.73 TaxID=1314790 RepID=A0A1Y1Y089_9FUNG|nr:NAD-dependent glycerol-3-phosphate dehydrogenase [Basidiobolus meristosporus CBS 931.73]|eukprot:ORX91421.1 NAD-dependent glycerol-3-phosphate dehydrogenase [Basidiobolus meristosporus CBS 931.73]
MTEKVCIIGSGNWGSTAAKIIGTNVTKYDEFDDKVNMWVHEEFINGESLTDIINTKHENVKYLPGVKLPENIVANSNLTECIKDATVFVFVIPPQFLKEVLRRMVGQIRPDARAISLIKGLDSSHSSIRFFSEIIHELLDIEVSVMSGANVASEVASENFCETTIGTLVKKHGKLFKKLFSTSYLKVTIVNDIIGVEICGALKHILGIAAGIVDGLDLGGNTKAAVVRIGLMEIIKFAKTFYPEVQKETFYESCGVAEMITLYYAGRNRMLGEAFVRTGKPFDVLENEMLNGQKLQGPITIQKVHDYLLTKEKIQEFPFINAVYQITYNGAPADTIIKNI